MMLKAGIVKHAIVIGVELPIVPSVVKSYLDTGVLSQNKLNDPYSPNTSGFHPAESVSALVLENSDKKLGPKVLGYWCNSDADSPIGMPEDGNGLKDCIDLAKTHCPYPIKAICPHASGTWLHAKAEQQALKDSLGASEPISLHLMKPFTGHTVGASGLLDAALLAHYLRSHSLPPNMKNLTQPSAPFTLPTTTTPIANEMALLKIAVGMGGHNSIVALSP